ncbi:hypothetical protein DL764_007430 [Monosporascus ibericus]|uniref:Uncharacterized protein n=1 Tax=Monosporascus ibericus TaxID=155417 RepID=A0A4Q4T2Y5_9PEZI|nr:hypothetical protein DL764_007430 [Monosporascus ibericus]
MAKYGDLTHQALQKLVKQRGLKQGQHAKSAELIELLKTEDKEGRQYERWDKKCLNNECKRRGIQRKDVEIQEQIRLLREADRDDSSDDNDSSDDGGDGGDGGDNGGNGGDNGGNGGNVDDGRQGSSSDLPSGSDSSSNPRPKKKAETEFPNLPDDLLFVMDEAPSSPAREVALQSALAAQQTIAKIFTSAKTAETARETVQRFRELSDKTTNGKEAGAYVDLALEAAEAAKMAADEVAAELETLRIHKEAAEVHEGVVAAKQPVRYARKIFDRGVKFSVKAKDDKNKAAEYAKSVLERAEELSEAEKKKVAKGKAPATDDRPRSPSPGPSPRSPQSRDKKREEKVAKGKARATDDRPRSPSPGPSRPRMDNPFSRPHTESPFFNPYTEKGKGEKATRKNTPFGLFSPPPDSDDGTRSDDNDGQERGYMSKYPDGDDDYTAKTSRELYQMAVEMGVEFDEWLEPSQQDPYNIRVVKGQVLRQRIREYENEQRGGQDDNRNKQKFDWREHFQSLRNIVPYDPDKENPNRPKQGWTRFGPFTNDESRWTEIIHPYTGERLPAFKINITPKNQLMVETPGETAASRSRGFILPVSQYETQRDKFRKYLRNHLPEIRHGDIEDLKGLNPKTQVDFDNSIVFEYLNAPRLVVNAADCRVLLRLRNLTDEGHRQANNRFYSRTKLERAFGLPMEVWIADNRPSPQVDDAKALRKVIKDIVAQKAVSNWASGAY